MRDEIIKEFHGDLTIEAVRKKYRVRHYTVLNLWKEEFGEEAVDTRKRLKYRESKLGSKNPMTGAVKSKHPRWKTNGDIADSHGYTRCRVPEWYTGPHADGYAREHIIVYCEAHGMTRLPEGFHIHHLDMDKKNNKLGNLIMLSNSDHRKLHTWVERTIVQRLSHMGVD